MSAAALIGAVLIGVDLLPATGGYVVLELNGAVEFDRSYDLEDSNVYAAAASALGPLRLTPPRRPTISAGSPASRSRGTSHRRSRV